MGAREKAVKPQRGRQCVKDVKYMIAWFIDWLMNYSIWKLSPVDNDLGLFQREERSGLKMSEEM
jgi:hypothetical protein